MEIIRDIPQGSPEWFKLKTGSIGGSRINSVMSEGKGKMRTKLLFEMSGEILTGVYAESYKFQHADRGHEFEPVARANYEFQTGNTVEQITMIKEGPYCHVSPDGLVGDEGMIEIKTRIPSVYIENLESGSIPTAEKRQIQWGLHISKLCWCDYVQYCPEMNKLSIQRVLQDNDNLQNMLDKVFQFIEDLKKLVEKYR